MTHFYTPIAPSTAEVLASMWTENTGRSILDSGDAYGRNWQRNQGLTVADMLASPEVTLDARFGWPEITVSAFHWLNSIVEYDPIMQRRYDLFNHGSDDPYLVDMERFAEAVDASRFGIDDGWSADRWQSVNTYNGDSWLDSVLQYVVFSWEGDDYVLLQYHGGCYVRGGYTAPRAFRLLDHRYDLYYEGNVTLECSEHHGADLGPSLYSDETRDAVHAWNSSSSGVEWSDYDGSYMITDFEVVEPEDGDPYVKCPECDGHLSVYVSFGH